MRLDEEERRDEIPDHGEVVLSCRGEGRKRS
jgi:hypothetical protein